MKRLFYALIVLLWVFPAFAQVPMTGGGKGVPGGAPTPTTLNPSDKAAGIALSGGNLVATGSGNVRSTSSHSTGKFYYEVVFDATAGSSYNHGTGFANSTASLTAGPGSPDTNSIAIYMGDVNIYAAGGTAGSSGIFLNPGDRVGIAIDIGSALMWVRSNGGNWNNNVLNNPTTGVGGVSVAGVSTPWFVISSGNVVNAINTYNFCATACVDIPPSTYGNY